jgi:hypothetical protein
MSAYDATVMNVSFAIVFAFLFATMSNPGPVNDTIDPHRITPSG